MKNLCLLFGLLLLGNFAIAQPAGSIKYKEVIKLEFDFEAPAGMDLSDMLPESTTRMKDLFFDGKVAVYRDAKENESDDMEMESDDGAMKIVIKTSESEDVFYTDLDSKTATFQTGFMGKEFLIEEKIEKSKWKLTGEKIKYLDYECHKATMTIPAEEEGEEDEHIVAWFTPQIPAQVGPAEYNQLPGAILMLSVDGDKHEIMATEVNLATPTSEQLKKPSKGEKVTHAEFEKIVEEKEKEMEEMYGGRGIRIRH